MRVDADSHGLLIARLKDLHVSNKTWAEVARTLGVSRSYLCDVLLGRRDPGDAILRPLGLERVVSYKELVKTRLELLDEHAGL